MSWPRGLLLAALLLGLRSEVVAESASQEQIVFPRSATGTAAEPRGDSSSSGKALLGLAVICAVAGGWLLWRRRTASASLAGGGRRLKVVETQSLGNRQFLVVAEYDGRKVLLGVCPGRIELLTHLEDLGSDEA